MIVKIDTDKIKARIKHNEDLIMNHVDELQAMQDAIDNLENDNEVLSSIVKNAEALNLAYEA